MANLGTLTTKLGLDIRRRVIPIHAAGYPYKDNGSDVPVNGSITGNVKDGVNNIIYGWVHLYYRPTGEKISSARTDSSGNFTFYDLQYNQSLYFVVALDPDGGNQYNALIYDRVAPV